MALDRQLNIKGQMRLDVPHLRSIESAVAHDFDVLAGNYMAGRMPVIVKGFAVVTPSTSTPAASLQIAVAGSVVAHFGASENGTLFSVPDNRAVETLSPSNARVVGGFVANTTNYVGIDFVRTEDTSTSDVVQFLDAATLAETPKTIPLGRTVDYQIIISTSPFSTATTVCPVAIVKTSATNQVSATDITDARNLMFRLGSGGDYPSVNFVFQWPQGRTEGAASDFVKADKAITNEFDWKNAIMTRLWELGGGEKWYAPTSDRNVKLTKDPTKTFASSSDAFEWVASNLHWKGLSVVFDNSTAFSNSIADQITNSAGLTDLVAGDCLYVDIDRTQLVAVTAQKGKLATLGTPTIPGSRFIIAWCTATNVVWTRDFPNQVGVPLAGVAGVNGVGGVGMSLLNAASYVPAAPVVPVIDNLGRVVGTGLSRKNTGGTSIAAGSLNIGNDALDTSVTISNSAALLTIYSTQFNVTTAGNTTTGTGTLTVGGLATFSAAGTALTVTNNATVSGILTAPTIAATTITGAVSASGLWTFGSAGTAVTITNNASIGGTLGVTGVLTATNGLWGDVAAKGAAGSALNVGTTTQTGTVNIGRTGQAAAVLGNATIAGTLGVTGNTTLAVLGAGATTVNSLTCTTTATITGTLGAGASTLASLVCSGAATIGTTLGVTGLATLSTLTVTGATTLAASTLASLAVTNNATVGGTLVVTGNASFTAGVTVGGTPLSGAQTATLTGGAGSVADALHTHTQSYAKTGVLGAAGRINSAGQVQGTVFGSLTCSVTGGKYNVGWVCPAGYSWYTITLSGIADDSSGNGGRTYSIASHNTTGCSYRWYNNNGDTLSVEHFITVWFYA